MKFKVSVLIRKKKIKLKKTNADKMRFREDLNQSWIFIRLFTYNLSSKIKRVHINIYIRSKKKKYYQETENVKIRRFLVSYI